MTTYKKSIVHKALIRKSRIGGYWAEVPSMPGCFSQADTLPEMRRMIDEAMSAWEPGCVSIPHPADENALIKPELVQAICRHCCIPEDEVDELSGKKFKVVHAAGSVERGLYLRAERKAKRHGRKMADVLSSIIEATYEQIAAPGNPFAPAEV